MNAASATMPERIAAMLQAAFAPEQLEVRDDGQQHIGHSGEGKGHFHVRIVSAAFAGTTPIQRHRLVYAALAELMDHGIHALAIDAQAAPKL
jgi:BolA protein